LALDLIKLVADSVLDDDNNDDEEDNSQYVNAATELQNPPTTIDVNINNFDFDPCIRVSKPVSLVISDIDCVSCTKK